MLSRVDKVVCRSVYFIRKNRYSELYDTIRLVYEQLYSATHLNCFIQTCQSFPAIFNFYMHVPYTINQRPVNNGKFSLHLLQIFQTFPSIISPIISTVFISLIFISITIRRWPSPFLFTANSCGTCQ